MAVCRVQLTICLFNAISHTRWTIIAHNSSCSSFSFTLCNPVRESELAPCERKPVLVQTQSGTAPVEVGGAHAEGESAPRCYIFPPSPLPLVFVVAACARRRRAEGWSAKLLNHFLVSLRTAVDWPERPLCPPSRPASQQMCSFIPSGACLQRGR